MECKWLKEVEKISKKEKHEMYYVNFTSLAIFIVANIITYLKQKNSPYFVAVLVEVNFAVFIAISIISIIALIRNNKNLNSNNKSGILDIERINKNSYIGTLREELSESLKTSEDYKLIDEEVYGNLKRKVTLGKNDLTFTPHFLIQKFTNVKYTVMKLQNVAYMKTDVRDKYGYTEFFDANNKRLGSIENTAFNSKVFNKICREQIPWAEFR